MKTIQEFCNRHTACMNGEIWAVANCKTIQDAWDAAKPEWLIWIATRNDVLTDKELRLFAVWVARQAQHLMTDQRSINALAVAERFANGEANTGELRTAEIAAWAAAMAAKRARAAARAAAWAAAGDAGNSAWNAAWAAARADKWTTARDAQAKWLREHTTPCFA